MLFKAALLLTKAFHILYKDIFVAKPSVHKQRLSHLLLMFMDGQYLVAFIGDTYYSIVLYPFGHR